jgi:hypothetical protein
LSFKNARALFNDLYDHVWEAIRASWFAEMKQVESSLNEQKDQLADQIFSLFRSSEVGRKLWRRAKEIKSFRFSDFRFVQTELPEMQDRPPVAATYARPEGSPVSISARPSTQINAVVETFNWLSLGFLIGQPRPSDEPVATAKTEDAQLHEDLNVSLTGRAQWRHR